MTRRPEESQEKIPPVTDEVGIEIVSPRQPDVQSVRCQKCGGEVKNPRTVERCPYCSSLVVPSWEENPTE